MNELDGLATALKVVAQIREGDLSAVQAEVLLRLGERALDDPSLPTSTTDMADALGLSLSATTRLLERMSELLNRTERGRTVLFTLNPHGWEKLRQIL